MQSKPFKGKLLTSLTQNKYIEMFMHVSRYFYYKIHMPDICDIVAGSVHWTWTEVVYSRTTKKMFF